LVDVESSVPDIARHLVQGRAQAYSRVFIEYQLFLQLALCDGLDSKKLWFNHARENNLHCIPPNPRRVGNIVAVHGHLDEPLIYTPTKHLNFLPFEVLNTHTTDLEPASGLLL